MGKQCRITTHVENEYVLRSFSDKEILVLLWRMLKELKASIDRYDQNIRTKLTTEISGLEKLGRSNEHLNGKPLCRINSSRGRVQQARG